MPIGVNNYFCDLLIVMAEHKHIENCFCVNVHVNFFS